MHIERLTFPLLVAVSLCTCSAYPTYPSLLPNAGSIPCPSTLSTAESTEQCPAGTCAGIGHTDCRGGSFKSPDGAFLNPFGKAFAAAGYEWTPELCGEDSDGDGATNGQELGDPCCTWAQGDPSPVDPDYQLSHPGVPGDTTQSPLPSAEECAELQGTLGTAGGFDSAAFVESMFNPGEEQREMTLQVQNHTLLPNETIYTNVFFPLPQNETLYFVGAVPFIDNKLRNHHFITYVCTGPLEEYTTEGAGFPNQPPSAQFNGFIPPGCENSVYGWAPGNSGIKMPEYLGIKLGKGTGFQTFFLQVHYNNVDGVTDEMDASGITVYFTPQPREHEASLLWAGSVTEVGSIPPNTRYFNAHHCTLRLKPGCDKVTAISHAPHAHGTGRAVVVEHYSADMFGNLEYVQDIGREAAFNYDLQYIEFLETPVDLKNGDVLAAYCMYDTAGRTETTRGGLASEEEMCLDAMIVYPADCVYSYFCIGPAIGGEITDSAVDGNSPGTDVYPLGTAPNYAAAADELSLECDLDVMFNSTEPELTTLLAAFNAACPGVLDPNNLGSLGVRLGFGLLQPEEMAAYECPESCSEFILNAGVCWETTMKEEYEAVLQAFGAFSPASIAPPSCARAITANLLASSGQPSSETSAAEAGATVESAALEQGGRISAGAALLASAMASAVFGVF